MGTNTYTLLLTKFYSPVNRHYLITLVIFYNESLFTWVFSVFQFTLGGFEELQEMKVRHRERLNLPPLPEDSIKVVRAMRAASPPASAMELIEQQQQQKRGRRSRRVLALKHTRISH